MFQRKFDHPISVILWLDQRIQKPLKILDSPIKSGNDKGIRIAQLRFMIFYKNRDKKLSLCAKEAILPFLRLPQTFWVLAMTKK